MNDNEISIKVEYTQKDFLDGIRLFKSNSSARVSSILLPVLALTSASFSLFLALNSGDGRIFNYLFILAFYILGIYSWFDRSGNLTSRRLFRRFQREDSLRLELGANNRGIYSNSSTSSNHQNWDSITKFYENEYVFIVVLKSKQFITFPKRSFSKPEDIIAFRDLVNANVPEYKLVN